MVSREQEPYLHPLYLTEFCSFKLAIVSTLVPFQYGDFVSSLTLKWSKVFSWNYVQIQSTLVISTPVISNNRLSRRENLIPVLTQKSNIR